MDDYKLPEPIGEHTHFNWGPVEKIHTIGEISIVEYVSKVGGDIRFCVYVDGKDCHQGSLSLAGAMILALAIIHIGRGNDAQHAAKYASKILDIPSDY